MSTKIYATALLSLVIGIGLGAVAQSTKNRRLDVQPLYGLVVFACGAYQGTLTIDHAGRATPYTLKDYPSNEDLYNSVLKPLDDGTHLGEIQIPCLVPAEPVPHDFQGDPSGTHTDQTKAPTETL